MLYDEVIAIECGVSVTDLDFRFDVSDDLLLGRSLAFDSIFEAILRRNNAVILVNGGNKHFLN